MFFKAEIFTPDSFDEDDAYNDLGEELSYIIYNSRKSMCEEQRNIVDNALDFTGQSSALRALPQLTGINVRFGLMTPEQEWLYPYLLD